MSYFSFVNPKSFMPTLCRGAVVALVFTANTLQHRTMFIHNHTSHYNVGIAAMQTAGMLTVQG